MASVAQTLVKIEIVDKPQTEYRYKKEFDKSGLTLLATYSDGSTKTISDTNKINYKNYNSKQRGVQVVTIEYEGCSTELSVTVKYTWWQWIIKILLFGFIWY